MGNLKDRLREQLGEFGPAMRDDIIARVFAALDRPTVLMVDAGQRVFDDLSIRFDTRGKLGPPPPPERDVVETIFARMVDAGRNGA